MAGPTPLAEDLVQTVRVRPLIGVRDQLTAFDRTILALLARRRRYPPLDFGRVERIEQLNSDLLDARRREAASRYCANVPISSYSESV